MWTPINRDWTVKPPLGTPLRTDGHWSVQGLAGCWLFNEGAGKPIDLVSGQPAVLMGSGVSWQQNGLYITGQTGTNVGIPVLKRLPNLARATVICGAEIHASERDWEELGGLGNGGYNDFHLAFQAAQKDTNKLTAFAQLDNYWETGAGVLTTTRNTAGICSVAQTYSGSMLCGYLNGKFVTSGIEGSGPIQACSAFIGGRENCSCVSMPALWQYMLVYARALDPAEIASLSANPYQVCQP